MNFSVSRRFQSGSSQEEIVKFLEDSFRKSSENTYNNGGVLTAESVNATFGSINRTDKTVVEVKIKDGETLIVANTEYKTSIWYWIFFILGLFTTFCWLIPIGFYFYHKGVVKKAIEEIFNRTENEFRGKKATTSSKTASSEDTSAQLEKLASLKEKGILSDEEFAAQKAKILANM